MDLFHRNHALSILGVETPVPRVFGKTSTLRQEVVALLCLCQIICISGHRDARSLEKIV
jgi:hypothetical protein